MRVMYVANNPDGAEPLQIEREINDLQERLERGVGVEPIVMRTYSALMIDRFSETVARVQPDVLHVAAHGEDGAIILSHPDREDVRVDGEALASLLGILAQRPKLVVLNACSSDEMARDLASAGGAEFVIGTDARISNVGARAMAAALYQTLADAGSISEAFEAAATQLRLIDGGTVAVHLHTFSKAPDPSNVRLVNPFRIVACFPAIEDRLDHGLLEPGNDFKPARPQVLFGVAGAPLAARQTVIFTDDDTVGGDRANLEADRSWIVEKQPEDGEIWLDDSYEYFGDMNWFAAVTTTDGRVVSASSRTTKALERYYLDERWGGNLPPAIEQAIRRSLEHLKREAGGRRLRRAVPA